MTDIVADARQAVTTGGGPYEEMWDGEPYELVLLLCAEIETLRAEVRKLNADIDWLHQHDGDMGYTEEDRIRDINEGRAPGALA